MKITKVLLPVFFLLMAGCVSTTTTYPNSIKAPVCKEGQTKDCFQPVNNKEDCLRQTKPEHQSSCDILFGDE